MSEGSEVEIFADSCTILYIEWIKHSKFICGSNAPQIRPRSSAQCYINHKEKKGEEQHQLVLCQVYALILLVIQKIAPRSYHCIQE